MNKQILKISLVLLFLSVPAFAEHARTAVGSKGADIDVLSFGAVCNANYYNPKTNDWYVDATFAKLANDDTAGIQAAVDSVRVTKNTDRNDPFSASFSVAKKIRFPSGQRCRISSPVLIEADASSLPVKYMDNVVIDAYGAQIVASSGFAGVSRYYDTKHTETIKAMLVMGTKNFGRDIRSDYQSYNKILGLQFVGNGDQELAAVYIEAGSGYQLQDLHLERLGFGIKTRLLRHSIIANIEAIDTHSLIYSYNDTSDIKRADPLSHWEIGGSEGGNLILSNMYYMTRPETMLEVNKIRGALHFYNTGELKITNVAIFGGSKAIVLDGQGYNAVSGNKWNLISNVEIAETELEPLYFNGKRYISLSNANITWCFKNTQKWASADYFAPYLNFNDVRNSIFTNIIIDRDNFENSYKGGHDIKLTNSVGNTFANITITGRPGSSDGAYSHINLVNSSYNKLHQVNCIDIEPSIRWKYGLDADMTSDFNQFTDSTMRLLKTKGNEVNYRSNSNNVIRYVTFD